MQTCEAKSGQDRKEERGLWVRMSHVKFAVMSWPQPDGPAEPVTGMGACRGRDLGGGSAGGAAAQACYMRVSGESAVSRGGRTALFDPMIHPYVLQWHLKIYIYKYTY